MPASGLVLLLLSMLLELPSVALRVILLSPVIQATAGGLGNHVDGLLVAALAFAPLIRALAVLVFPLGVSPFMRAAIEARRPSESEQRLIWGAAGGLPPRAIRRIWVVEGSTGEARTMGSSIVLTTALIQGRFLRPVLAHEAGHVVTGDGRIVLAGWWLPIRSLAAIASRLEGRPVASVMPRAPSPTSTGPTGPIHLIGLVAGLILRCAGGGLSLKLTRPLWRRYRASCERRADEYAASRGQGPALARALEESTGIDLVLPSGETIPIEVQGRIARLRG